MLLVCVLPAFPPTTALSPVSAPSVIVVVQMLATKGVARRQKWVLGLELDALANLDDRIDRHCRLGGGSGSLLDYTPRSTWWNPAQVYDALQTLSYDEQATAIFPKKHTITMLHRWQPVRVPKTSCYDGVPVPERLRAIPGLAKAGEDLAEVESVGKVVHRRRWDRRPEGRQDNFELRDLLHEQRDNVSRAGDGEVGDIPGVVALSAREGGEEASEGDEGARPDRVFAAVGAIGLDGETDEEDEGLGEMRRAVCARVISARTSAEGGRYVQTDQ